MTGTQSCFNRQKPTNPPNDLSTFSLIKMKCENHTQMSVRQFAFWPCALLSGFYGIFYVFKGSFGFSFAEKIPKLFFARQIPPCMLENLPFYLNARSPHLMLQSNRDCLFNQEVPNHSVTHINEPPRLLPCLPSLSLSLLSLSIFCLCLSKHDKKTYGHLNKHRQSVVSLSAQPWGNRSFMWCARVSLCV